MKTPVVVLALTLACCGASLAASAGSARVEHAKAVILENLRDPESARFRSIYQRSSTQIHNVCGQVNAKNGFGGYVGYRRFIVWSYSGLPSGSPGTEVSIEGVEEQEAFEAFWKLKCVLTGASKHGTKGQGRVDAR